MTLSLSISPLEPNLTPAEIRVSSDGVNRRNASLEKNSAQRRKKQNGREEEKSALEKWLTGCTVARNVDRV